MNEIQKQQLARGRTTPLRGQVTDILRGEILSGRLKPGSIMNEKDLADRLGVSKTPVREALTLLDHDGLVQTLPRKGYFVSPITIQDVHNFFQLRVILECAVAEMAVTKITDAQIDELERLAASENPAEDATEEFDKNVRFHYFIACVSGNERLASLIRKLLLEERRMISTGYMPQEHERLIAALRERDPHRTAEAVRNHIHAVRDKVLRGVVPSLTGEGSQSDPAR
jgi:DNA-binding GntR family transcriptional regulator